jgi:hypothetical protein
MGNRLYRPPSAVLLRRTRGVAKRFIFLLTHALDGVIFRSLKGCMTAETRHKCARSPGSARLARRGARSGFRSSLEGLYSLGGRDIAPRCPPTRAVPSSARRVHPHGLARRRKDRARKRTAQRAVPTLPDNVRAAPIKFPSRAVPRPSLGIRGSSHAQSRPVTVSHGQSR